MIRLVTFDALHTLITPRKPIHVQYSEVFSSYLGTLPPDAIARSFKLGVLFSYTFHIATRKAQTNSRQRFANCRSRDRRTVQARRRGGARSFPGRPWAR